MPTFRVEELGRKSTAGETLYAVVMYDDDGTARGADHHWVRQRYAERAAHLYADSPHLHGQPSATLAAVYRERHGVDMFDPDEEKGSWHEQGYADGINGYRRTLESPADHHPDYVRGWRDGVKAQGTV